MSGPLFAAKPAPRLSAERAGVALRLLSPTYLRAAHGSAIWRRMQLTASFRSAYRVFSSPQRRHITASAAPGPIARSGSRPPALPQRPIPGRLAAPFKIPRLFPRICLWLHLASPPSPVPRSPRRDRRCAHGWMCRRRDGGRDCRALSMRATASKRASGLKASDAKSEIRKVPGGGGFWQAFTTRWAFPNGRGMGNWC